MTSGPSIASNESRRPRGRLVIGVATLGATALLLAFVWFYVLGPRPPEGATIDAGPGVAEDIGEARSNVRLRPFAADAWGNLGIVLQLYQNYQEAGQCFDQAARLAPWSPRWPYLKAVIVLRSDLEAAVPLLERSVRRGGKILTPRLVLGETQLLRNQPGEAEIHFRQVLASEPRNARALLGLARAACAREDYRSALDLLEQARASAPRISAIHALLAHVYRRLGDEGLAAAANAEAAKLPKQAGWPDPYRLGFLSQLRGESAVVFRSTTLTSRGQAQDARALLQETLRRLPESPSLHRALGRTLVALQDYPQATSSFREAIRLQPDSLETQYECGRVLEHTGAYAEAVECYRTALRLHPEHGESHYHLGKCMESLPGGGDPISAYRNAIRYRPNLVEAHQALGAYLASLRRDAEALPVLRDALELDPKHPPTLQLLAAVEARLRSP